MSESAKRPPILTPEEMAALYRSVYPTRWSRVKAWVRKWIHRYRVRHLYVGQRVVAGVGTKGGEGIVRARMQDATGRHISYLVEFPDASYPHTMVVPVGTYNVPASHIVQVFP